LPRLLLAIFGIPYLLLIGFELMKLITIFCVVWLFNISTVQPVRADFQPKAGDITTPDGAYEGANFSGDGWQIQILKNSKGYIYSAKKNGIKEIRIANGKLTKSGGKHIYKWNNGGTTYQVTWRPIDIHYARVQIFDRNGKEIFNKLMWNSDGD
jgi:hypothetical protein